MMIPMNELINLYQIEPRGIIHVGAHEGQELESYLECKIPKVIWIEANPEIFSTLQKRLADYPHHLCYQFAAHEVDGKTVELNVMENTMSSSILYPKKHLELYPHVPVTKKVEVKTKTLDTLFDQSNLNPNDFNFLNMDIQGAELLALKGANKILNFVDYIYTEVNDDFLFDGCCLTKELDSFLKKYGFNRVATRMTRDDWGDALYINERVCKVPIDLKPIYVEERTS